MITHTSQFIERITTEDGGNDYMIDLVHLRDGQVLGVTDDCAVVYPSRSFVEKVLRGDTPVDAVKYPRIDLVQYQWIDGDGGFDHESHAASIGSAYDIWMSDGNKKKLANIVKSDGVVRSSSYSGRNEKKWADSAKARMGGKGFKLFDREDNYDSHELVFVKPKVAKLSEEESVVNSNSLETLQRGASDTMKLGEFILRVTQEYTVDLITLDDGKVLGIDGDTLCLYENERKVFSGDHDAVIACVDLKIEVPA